MKLNTHTKFTPKTFTITIESEDELDILKALFNTNGAQVIAQLDDTMTLEKRRDLQALYLKTMQMPLYNMVSK